MIPTHYDEFSTYTTQEDVIDFINELIESGLESGFDIYDKCIENFGKYFQQELYIFEE